MDANAQLKDIQQKSSKGIKWQGIAEVFIRALQFSTTIILARLLIPQDFGLISVALIFTQLAFVVFDFGFSSALVQKKEVNALHFSTTFVLYLFSALFFAALVMGLSPFAAAFFKQEILQKILNTLVIVFFFYAFNAIPRILLIREMAFKRFGTLQIISVFCYSVVTIILAWRGAGVWAFVYGSIAEQFVLTVLLNIFSPWRPSFKFDKEVFKELLNFGGNVMGTRISGYINANSPNFIIGRILGTAQLGFYSIAYQLIEFPVQRISKSVLRVMFPAFSKLQDDHENFRILYKQTIYHLALVTFPIFVGLVLIAPQFVLLFYGPKWTAAIVPIQLLTATGLFRSFWASASVILLSKGRPKIEFHVNLVYSIFLIPAIIAGTTLGVNGVAAIMAVVMFVFLIILQYRSLRIIELSLIDLGRSLWLPAAGVAAFALFSFICRQLFFDHFSDLIQLLFTVITSALIYGGIILKFDRNILKKIKQFLGA